MNTLDERAQKYFFWLYLIWFITPLFFTFFWLFIVALLDSAGEGYQILLIVVSVALLIICTVITIISYIWSTLVVKNYYYKLDEQGFKKDYGVIFKKNVAIPYQKIQNIDIHRGILARIMGLADLNIQTAGMTTNVRGNMSGGSEGRLPAIDYTEALRLRDEIMKNIQ